MTRLVLEQVTDFGDFTRGTDLGEFLKQTNSNGCWNNSLSNVRVSPDGRHIHVILRKPKVGLMTYDKYQRPQMTHSPKHLDLGPTRTSPIVDLLYLDHVKNRDGGGVALVAVVFENGTAEFWRFLECQAGWSLLHTSDLCNSPRAKVVSVSAGSGCVVWCEERPPSESSSSSAPSAARNSFRYCICKRSYEVDDGGAVSLGGVKIALHNNPCYTVVSSGENVYLLPPNAAEQRCGGASSQGFDKFFLSWSPQHDTFRVSSACTGTLLRREDGPLGKESDFRRLVTDCVGYLSSLSPPEIRAFAPTGCGGLLLLLGTGWVSLLQRDGAIRRVYGGLSERGGAAVGPAGGGPLSLRLYGDTLALAAGRTLYLADARSGRELERIPLRSGSALLYADRADGGGAPRLLSEAGLFAVAPQAAPEGGLGAGGRLAEAVFEEACQYYQQRSLGSTRLTAEKLRRGGMFQAPVSLAAILRDHLSGAGAGGAGGAGGGGGPDRLRGALEAELKALVALEELKGRAVRGGEEEARALLEGLVQQEVGRLLSASAEPEREALLYLNSVFSRFPRQAWAAAQASLGLRCGGGGDDGSLCVRASPEVWKAVLAPVPGPGPAPPTPHRANGQPGGHTPAVKPGVPPHPAPSCSGPKPGPPDPAPLPVFELLCRSVLRYQPGWLPRFLEAAQQQQGSAGLGGLGGLGLGGSWSYSDAGRGGEATAGGGESLPLYKRALSVLAAASSRPDRDQNQDQDLRDLEVELLLVSGRPNAVLQALRVLMGARQWERVTRVAQRFCRSSPLLGTELFGALLGEVAQHRDLDPYLDLLWTLCPEELTVTSILNMVLKNLPSSSSSSSSSSSAPPFSEPGRGPLTVGLLKPLLSKVLQRETRPSQRYADILPSPGLPPPATPPCLPLATPPRHARGLPPPPPDQRNQQNQPLPPLDQQHDPPPTHWTLPGGRLTSPPNPV